MSDIFSEMFMSEPKESDLGRALRTKDEEYIKNYLKQFDTKKDNELFFILDKITVSRDLNFDVSSVNYNKYIIIEMLSRSLDCLGSVVTLNLIGDGLSNQQHYDYLVRTIPVGRKKYQDGSRKYLRVDAHEVLSLLIIMHVYGCNENTAKDYLEVLTVKGVMNDMIFQYRSYLETEDAINKMKKMIRHADQQKEFNLLVEEIMDIRHE